MVTELGQIWFHVKNNRSVVEKNGRLLEFTKQSVYSNTNIF